jgi:hypothetical protein
MGLSELVTDESLILELAVAEIPSDSEAVPTVDDVSWDIGVLETEVAPIDTELSWVVALSVAEAACDPEEPHVIEVLSLVKVSSLAEVLPIVEALPVDVPNASDEVAAADVVLSGPWMLPVGIVFHVAVTPSEDRVVCGADELSGKMVSVFEALHDLEVVSMADVPLILGSLAVTVICDLALDKVWLSIDG